MTPTLPWQRRPNCLAWAKVIWSGGRSKATPRGRANSFPPHRLRVASGSNGSACPTSLCRRLSPPRWNPSHKDWRHIIGRGRNWGSECSDVCCCFHCAHMYPQWNFFDLHPSLPYFQILPILISHVLSYFFNFLPYFSMKNCSRSFSGKNAALKFIFHTKSVKCRANQFCSIIVYLSVSVYHSLTIPTLFSWKSFQDCQTHQFLKKPSLHRNPNEITALPRRVPDSNNKPCTVYCKLLNYVVWKTVKRPIVVYLVQ